MTQKEIDGLLHEMININGPVYETKLLQYKKYMKSILKEYIRKLEKLEFEDELNPSKEYDDICKKSFDWLKEHSVAFNKWKK